MVRLIAFKCPDAGYTLIEVLVSILLFAIVFTGLVKTSVVVINTNTENLLRDEATTVADQQITQLQNTPFNALPAVYTQTTTTVAKNFRDTQNIFTCTQTVNPLDVNNKSVVISVSWTRKGQTRTQTYATLVRNTQ
jgi:prepilin-type N-terminal cleavage/methylation domain-containing protein